jgi:hypothetical protein
MADNVAITAGSGTTIAADDISGVLHQRVKLSLGADGSAADAPVGPGPASSSTLRVAPTYRVATTRRLPHHNRTNHSARLVRQAIISLAC